MKEEDEKILKDSTSKQSQRRSYLSLFICIPAGLHAIFRVSPFPSFPVSLRVRRWNVFSGPATSTKHSSASTRNSHSAGPWRRSRIYDTTCLWHACRRKISTPTYTALTGRRILPESKKWYFTWNVPTLWMLANIKKRSMKLFYFRSEKRVLFRWTFTVTRNVVINRWRVSWELSVKFHHHSKGLICFKKCSDCNV